QALHGAPASGDGPDVEGPRHAERDAGAAAHARRGRRVGGRRSLGGAAGRGGKRNAGRTASSARAAEPAGGARVTQLSTRTRWDAAAANTVTGPPAYQVRSG